MTTHGYVVSSRPTFLSAPQEIIHEARNGRMFILTELGVQEKILLTASHRSLVALAGYGLDMAEERLLNGLSQ